MPGYVQQHQIPNEPNVNVTPDSIRHYKMQIGVILGRVLIGAGLGRWAKIHRKQGAAE
jgi:hypothetical protein